MYVILCTPMLNNVYLNILSVTFVAFSDESTIFFIFYKMDAAGI